ncbi:PAS/PAC sensor signal transduction histidine kinase [Geobacter metallireducens RCH3]|uniref:histidine kinase n=1 Tax=Geobacter metallireducens (strain ATCC 53774 / DSM 7210 / GS-15) TaxID=269799 RepID=Q39XW6_GEOMG|nr:PAS domain S-box protein [Geobacter metallireducens]ABB30908.1 sensor histidine kinase, PAS and PAS domain-containing [Geobacter metallireducens GS-15]EHP84803.1 PAS/PAC sensor signal transduction histidine kinase [Geobacter metallireducens RCH3]
MPYDIFHPDREALMAIVEALPVAALYTEGDHICFNRAAERLIGYGMDEIRSIDDWFQKLHGPCNKKIREIYDSDRTAGFPAPRRVAITTKDGCRRHVEFSASGTDRIIYIMHDITDLVSAQEQVKENAARYQILNSTSMDGFWVVDQNGKIIEMNDACCAMLGYSREELLAINLRDIETAESSEETAKHMRALINSGYDRFETRHRRKDGSIIDVEISTTYERTTNCFLAFLRDITDHKHADKALRQSEERYRRFSSLTSDYVNFCSRQGDSPYRVRWMGGAVEAITGYSAEQIHEWGCWMRLVHPDDRDRVSSNVMKLAPGETYSDEFRIIAKNGTIHWILEACRCEAGEAPGELFLFGTSQDITERKLAEEEIRTLNETLERRVEERTAQLEAAIREQESFSYSVSHDLRAPLRHINSYSAMVIEDFEKQLPTEARRYLERIGMASARMGQLIDDLLELSRVNRVELHRSTINLSKTAAMIVAMFRETEPDRTVEWVIADGLTARADKILIRQVLLNLLGNALKYSAKTPQALIEFGTAYVEGERAFFVKDNGSGFNMAYVSKLFRPFQRLHGSEFQGTGIGLATVKRIIERHGGRVWAEGSVDAGATFYFTLPER